MHFCSLPLLSERVLILRIIGGILKGITGRLKTTIGRNLETPRE